MGTVVAHPVWVAPGESFKTGSSEKQERMAAYVEWLLTPEDQRVHKTKAAFAEALGVTPQTLNNYSKEAWVQRELADRARKVARVDKLPVVIDRLYKIATGEIEGTPAVQINASKALLDWMEKTSAVREAPLDVGDMTDEDLVSMALEVLQRVNEKG